MTTKTAILAGGCFWGLQDLIRLLPRMESTRVGFTGGENEHPTYRHHPGHAEAFEITYDPAKTQGRALLNFFFQIHDPATKNRQSNDFGTSHRSAIFYLDDDQKRIALDTIADVDASGLWPVAVVTEVTPASHFWEAELDHQDYLQRYPGGYLPLITATNLMLATHPDRATTPTIRRTHQEMRRSMPRTLGQSADAKFLSGSAVGLPTRPITTGLVGSDRTNLTREDQLC